MRDFQIVETHAFDKAGESRMDRDPDLAAAPRPGRKRFHTAGKIEPWMERGEEEVTRRDEEEEKERSLIGEGGGGEEREGHRR